MRFQSETCVFKFPRRRVDSKHLMRFQSETSVFKFLQRSVNGKHLMRFQSETSVFKFLLRSVNGKHLMRFQSETSVFKFVRRSVDGTNIETPLKGAECIFFRVAPYGRANKTRRLTTVYRCLTSLKNWKLTDVSTYLHFPHHEALCISV